MLAPQPPPSLSSTGATNEEQTSPCPGDKPTTDTRARALEPLRLPARPNTLREGIENENGEAPPGKEHRASSGHVAAQATIYEAPFQPRLFITNLQESAALMLEGIRGFIRNDTISATRKVLTVGGAAAAVAASTAYSIPWGLGALSFVMAKLGGCLTENKHFRAQGAVQGAILGGHFSGLGADAMATGSEIWAGRMLVQSMIPESRKFLSATVATTGIGLSCFMFCASPGFTPEFALQNAPLVAIVLSGGANALPDKWSWISRLVNLTCNSFMLPYHCSISGSWFLAALSGVWAHGHLKNILRHDLPRLKKRASTAETMDSGS